MYRDYDLLSYSADGIPSMLSISSVRTPTLRAVMPESLIYAFDQEWERWNERLSGGEMYNGPTLLLSRVRDRWTAYETDYLSKRAYMSAALKRFNGGVSAQYVEGIPLEAGLHLTVITHDWMVPILKRPVSMLVGGGEVTVSATEGLEPQDIGVGQIDFRGVAARTLREEFDVELSDDDLHRCVTIAGMVFHRQTLNYGINAIIDLRRSSVRMQWKDIKRSRRQSQWEPETLDALSFVAMTDRGIDNMLPTLCQASEAAIRMVRSWDWAQRAAAVSA